MEGRPTITIVLSSPTMNSALQQIASTIVRLPPPRAACCAWWMYGSGWD